MVGGGAHPPGRALRRGGALAARFQARPRRMFRVGPAPAAFLFLLDAYSAGRKPTKSMKYKMRVGLLAARVARDV